MMGSLLRNNALAILLLTIIHVFGINSMYGLIYRNGYIAALIRLRDNGPHLLPGSDNAILTFFTGIRPLDNLLTLAGVMFCNVTDGSAPALSLYAFQFAGQLVPILTILLIEAARSGNGKNLVRYWVIWACLMQSFGYGFIMPIYCVVHLCTSSIAGGSYSDLQKDILISNIWSLDTLAASMVKGYIVPTILIMLPVPSSKLHQWLLSLWQGFPIWVACFQWSSKPRNTSENLSKISADERPQKSSTGQTQSLLRRSYFFAFILAAAVQLLTILLLIARICLPHLFSDSLLDAWTFANVFLPPNPMDNKQMGSMAEAMLNFFQYDQYVGSMAAIVWATTLHLDARRDRMTLRSWLGLICETLPASLIAGPAGAFLYLLWSRDIHILEDVNGTVQTT